VATIKLTLTENRKRAPEILARLRKRYPDARCSLDYTNPLELLVATILAAQCTDARVNRVTPALFEKYRTPQDYIDAPPETLEEDIRTCGFYRNKANSIRNACRSIIEDFNGEVPGAMEELLQLGGVGRKTANVLLGECFDTPGIIVDTHCGRVSRRLGFSRRDSPVKIERDLMKIWPEEHWTEFSHLLVFHGRATCSARSPKCFACVVRELCPFPDTREGKKMAK
jgi:endonuclease III